MKEFTEDEIIILKRLIKTNGMYISDENRLRSDIQDKYELKLKKGLEDYHKKNWLQKLFTPYWNNPTL